MWDNNIILTVISMFLRSSNMTALVVRILSHVRVSGISKMAVCHRQSIHTKHLPKHLTWKNIRISPVIMLDAKNISKSVEISLLSRIQADTYFISYTLPVTGRHLWFLTHTDTRQCSDYPVMFLDVANTDFANGNSMVNNQRLSGQFNQLKLTFVLFSIKPAKSFRYLLLPVVVGVYNLLWTSILRIDLLIICDLNSTFRGRCR